MHESTTESSVLFDELASSVESGSFVIDSTREYRRPISNSEVVPKFPIEATIGEALKGVKYIKFEDGNYLNMDSYTKYDNFVIDWREIRNSNSVDDVIYILKQYPDQIYGLRFPGCRLPESCIDRVMSVICQHGLLQYLVDIDISYINLSHESAKSLSRLLDPAVSGYCPIKRMQLCHCNLKSFGVQLIFDACRSNVFLNEMNFSGNSCSDEGCQAIAKCLINPENRFAALSIGDNNISMSGIKLLCPGLSRHENLRSLMLSNNCFGDDGASILVKALKRSVCVEELNISNCGLTDCKWAKHLKYLASLASLNISCNRISDFGCLSICNGVQSCPFLRHLDLSNNPFGGVSCSGLGNLVETHGGLYSLNLSYCTLEHQVWSALAAGLSMNETLILLDIRWCNLTNVDAAELCVALEKNDVCSIDFSFNPVPEDLFDNCRTITHLLKRPQYAEVGLNNHNVYDPQIKPLELNDQCQILSLQRAEVWREDCQAKLDILLALQQFDSSGARREILDDEEDDDGLDALMKDEDVRIVYGNFQEEIGVIKIHASTTYQQIKSQITPLIRKYLGAAMIADSESESIKNLLYNFTFILKNGDILDGPSMQSRCVLPDVVHNHHTLIVRPGNWMCLGIAEDGEEDDYQSSF